jgi:Spondin_N
LNMRSSPFVFVSMVAATMLAAAAAQPVVADEKEHARLPLRYQITVVNITRGQQFTPLLLATHGERVRLFELGAAASPQLATLAEEGMTAPLAGLLRGTPQVRAVVEGSALTDPGRRATFTIRARPGDRLSLAAMLIPTNDAFVALNGIHLPLSHSTVELFARAYDAGSERNDELCSSIPGPSFVECGGPGGGARVGDGEGFVHIHSGIHGVGSLKEELRDWRNPVAKITIRRVD